MSELKPCPFCGSNDVVLEIDVSVTSIVYCSNCMAQAGGFEPVRAKDWKIPDEERNLDLQPWKSAVDAWNRRIENERT